MKALILVAAVMATATLGQKPARIGPDGKPLLNRPVLEECEKRISHMEWNGHNYFLSWREPWHKFEDWDWFNGRNFCRDRCMDLVSFDTPDEFKLFSAIMKQDNVSSIYTSGRKCNFKGKGCDAEHLQPINVNGWFWAGANNKRIAPTSEQSPESFWSPTGESGAPQPDNLEGVKEGPITTEFDIGVTIEGLQEFHDEACLVVFNNKYGEGIAWHDTACHLRSVIVCEDSDQLMTLVQSTDGVDVTGKVKKSEKALEVDSIRLNEVEPIKDPKAQPPAPPPGQRGQPGGRGRPGQRRPPRQQQGGPNGPLNGQQQQLGPNPGGQQQRPVQGGGLLGGLRGRFPFLF